MGDEHRTMRTGEVAAALGLSSATIQAYARKGVIPRRVTPGGQYRFDLDEVREVLAPSALDAVEGLADVFASGSPIVDGLTAFRTAQPSAAALRAARISGHRSGSSVRGTQRLSPSAGRDELGDLVERADGFAAVVLHRDPQPA